MSDDDRQLYLRSLRRAQMAATILVIGLSGILIAGAILIIAKPSPAAWHGWFTPALRWAALTANALLLGMGLVFQSVRAMLPGPGGKVGRGRALLWAGLLNLWLAVVLIVLRGLAPDV